MELPQGDFGVILADPPWTFRNGKGGLSGLASTQYPCMTVAEIAAVPVKNIGAENCALFMWTTSSMLADGVHLEIMRSWNFRPVTIAFVWNKTWASGKPYCGMGFYTRAGAEYCLLGIRGKVKRKSKSILQVITAPRVHRHSQKPDEQYERIEALFDGPYLEMFARQRREGWEGFGNEL